MTYNSWPLGSLPQEWQRPEPGMIKVQGYDWDDPRDIVGLFEQKLALYSGSKFAVLTDCCTNAIFLSLKYRGIQGERISIPANTYISVPMQIWHSGNIPVLEKRAWSGVYELGTTRILDGAARFTKGMYEVGSLHCLSFQIKKRLPIGRGGAILTDDKAAYEWLKLASYDGRDLTSPYDSLEHVLSLGWHSYMTPEDAARGILLMDQLPDVNEDTMTDSHYPDLRKWSVVKAIAEEAQ